MSSTVLGMLLFIASEVMLFGSFFTAYFFVRVVNGFPWPPEGFELPRYVAGVNTAILITSSFTVHWALQSIRRGNRAGMQAGLVLTFLMGLTFLLTQMIEYARVGFAPHDNAFTTVFFSLSQMLKPRMLALPSYFFASSVRCGMLLRHGTHQVAQNSTT